MSEGAASLETLASPRNVVLSVNVGGSNGDLELRRSPSMHLHSPSGYRKTQVGFG